MAGTHVRSSWMICVAVLLHCALICLAMESGMTLNDVQSEFDSSMRRALSTNVSDQGDLLGPLLEEATLFVEVCPSACKRISC